MTQELVVDAREHNNNNNHLGKRHRLRGTRQRNPGLGSVRIMVR